MLLGFSAPADTTGRAHDTMSVRVELAADNIRLLALVDSGGRGAAGMGARRSPRAEPAILAGRRRARRIHDTALEGRMLTVRGPINRFRLVDASSDDQSFAL
ncbi:MAG: hypothetical protein QOE94_2027 [Mycobacterium sp.]|nr:hypothetical protein [Mycobacterium sp.]